MLLTTLAESPDSDSNPSSLAAEFHPLGGFAAPFSREERRRGGKADHFVTAQCFEKWLNAAAHEAAQATAVDLHLADP